VVPRRLGGRGKQQANAQLMAQLPLVCPACRRDTCGAAIAHAWPGAVCGPAALTVWRAGRKSAPSRSGRARRCLSSVCGQPAVVAQGKFTAFPIEFSPSGLFPTVCLRPRPLAPLRSAPEVAGPRHAHPMRVPRRAQQRSPLSAHGRLPLPSNGHKGQTSAGQCRWKTVGLSEGPPVASKAPILRWTSNGATPPLAEIKKGPSRFTIGGRPRLAGVALAAAGH